MRNNEAKNKEKMDKEEGLVKNSYTGLKKQRWRNMTKWWAKNGSSIRRMYNCQNFGHFVVECSANKDSKGVNS